MNSHRNLVAISPATRPVEHPGKFTSRWAIPRVDPQPEPNPKKKKRQINNLVFLFFIYVFKQTKKFVSRGKK